MHPTNEFYEDFSGWEITNEDLEEMLIDARRENNIRLRRFVKHTQYLRFLIPKLLELVEETNVENPIVAFSRAAVRNKKKES